MNWFAADANAPTGSEGVQGPFYYPSNLDIQNPKSWDFLGLCT